MRQKLMLLCAVSFSLVSSLTFAHSNSTSNTQRPDPSNFNWGNGPSTTENTNRSRDEGSTSHTENTEKPNFNWGNGPSEERGGDRNNFNWGNGPSQSRVSDASNFNWGTGPN